jgi:hypothetical protein
MMLDGTGLIGGGLIPESSLVHRASMPRLEPALHGQEDHRQERGNGPPQKADRPV